MIALPDFFSFMVSSPKDLSQQEESRWKSWCCTASVKILIDFLFPR